MAETFNRASAILSTTSTTDVYQAPNTNDADRAVVLSCLVANVDGTNAADITLLISSAGNVDISRIAHTIQVPADSTLEAIPNKLILKRGEKIRAIASAADDLHVTVSALEITP